MSACFTTSWDDGHPLDQRLAERLARHGCGATFYVPLRNREGRPVMTGLELRALNAGFEIGSHTLDHAYADRMPPSAWAQQVIEGKRALEDQLGQAVPGFCYPGGRVTPQAVASVRAAGFAYARTIVNLHTAPGDDLFRAPTTLQLFPHSRAVLLRNWLRGGALGARAGAAAVAMRHGDWRERVLSLMRLARAHDASFHLWGHSWEIEQQGLWTDLETVLREAAGLYPPSARCSNAQWLGLAPASPAVHLATQAASSSVAGAPIVDACPLPDPPSQRPPC